MIDKITKKIYKIRRNKELEGTMFGELIKEERMKYGFTQDSISYHGLGYSSKVEKGLIIPSFDYIKDIGEVMNLDFYQLSPAKKTSVVYKPLIHHFIFNNHQALEALFNYASKFTHPSLKTIIAFSIDLIGDNAISADKKIDYITNHLHTFDQLLRQFSITLIAIYYYNQNAFTHTIKILRALKETEEDLSKDIVGLMSHYLYLSYQAIHCHAYANTFLGEALDYYRKKKAFDKVTELELIHLETLYHESRHQVSLHLDDITIEDSWSIKQRHHYLYLEVMSRLFEKDKQDDLAVRVINCLNEKNLTYYAIKLMIESYDILPFTQKEKSLIVECLNHIPKHPDFKLLKLHWQSLSLKGDELKTFLKDEALPIATASNDLRYIKYFTDQLIDLSIINHRYKEGIYHQKKYHRILGKQHTLS